MRLVRAPRLPSIPAGAAVALGAVAGILALNELIGWWRGAEGVALCGFRGVTGLPCPGCGGTRAIRALLGGEMIAALKLNPLVCAVVAAAVAVAVLRLGFGRRIQADFCRRDRVVAVAVILIAVLANWGYLLLARH